MLTREIINLEYRRLNNQKIVFKLDNFKPLTMLQVIKIMKIEIIYRIVQSRKEKKFLLRISKFEKNKMENNRITMNQNKILIINLEIKLKYICIKINKQFLFTPIVNIFITIFIYYFLY